MSMQSHPCSGMTIELIRLRSLIKKGALAEFDRLREGVADSETWVEFLDGAFKDNRTPRPADVIYLRDEDFSHDLSLETLYAVFDDDDIYEKAVRPEARAMEKLIGDLPEFNTWTVFG